MNHFSILERLSVELENLGIGALFHHLVIIIPVARNRISDYPFINQIGVQ